MALTTLPQDKNFLILTIKIGFQIDPFPPFWTIMYLIETLFMAYLTNIIVVEDINILAVKKLYVASYTLEN